MNEIQKEFALKTTKKIYSLPISVYFLNPVDPIKDNVPDYFEKISKPMDLGTVLQKLESDAYSSVDEWKKDVNLIWKNALNYHKNNEVIIMIAKELMDVFKSYTELIPRSELEAWTYKVRRMQSKLDKLINSKPEAINKQKQKSSLQKSASRNKGYD